MTSSVTNHLLVSAAPAPTLGSAELYLRSLHCFRVLPSLSDFGSAAVDQASGSNANVADASCSRSPAFDSATLSEWELTEYYCEWFDKNAPAAESVYTWEPARSLPFPANVRKSLHAELTELPYDPHDDDGISVHPGLLWSPENGVANEYGHVLQVEAILGYCTSPTGNDCIFIKWKHLPITEATWEPLSNVIDQRGLEEELRQAKQATEERRFNAVINQILNAVSEPQSKRLRSSQAATQTVPQQSIPTVAVPAMVAPPAPILTEPEKPGKEGGDSSNASNSTASSLSTIPAALAGPESAMIQRPTSCAERHKAHCCRVRQSLEDRLQLSGNKQASLPASREPLCLCGRGLPRMWPDTRARIVRQLNQSLPPGQTKSADQCRVKCTRCGINMHIDCSLKFLDYEIGEAWPQHKGDVSSLLHPLNFTKLKTVLENAICPLCYITDADPFLPVEEILGIQMIGAAECNPATLTTEARKKLPPGLMSARLDVTCGTSELEAFANGTRLLQLRGVVLNSAHQCYPKLPHSVKLFFSSDPNRAAGADEDIAPPPMHRIRKDTVRSLPASTIWKEPWVDLAKTLPGTRRIWAQCKFGGWFDGPYVMAITKGRPQRTTQELQEEVTRNDVRSKGEGRKYVFEFLHELAQCQGLHEQRKVVDDTAIDEGVGDVQLVATPSAAPTMCLTCPSTLMRTALPARSVHCKHLQCFDLDYFMFSQVRLSAHVARWRCPVCRASARPHELYVDGYVQYIVRNTGPTDRTVQFDVAAGAGKESVVWRVVEKDVALAADEEDYKENGSCDEEAEAAHAGKDSRRATARAQKNKVVGDTNDCGSDAESDTGGWQADGIFSALYKESSVAQDDVEVINDDD